MVLCNYCKLSLECRPPDAYVNHHKRLKDLEASSSQCQLCKLILSGVNSSPRALEVRGANSDEYRYISLVSRSNRGGGRRRRITFSSRSWTGEVMRSVSSLTNEGKPTTLKVSTIFLLFPFFSTVQFFLSCLYFRIYSDILQTVIGSCKTQFGV